MEYVRPSVDNLINNLPSMLKSSRQFLPWNPERGGKKVPLKPDGRSWGNYNDPACWRTFDDAIELLERRRAFGIGLVLPSPEHIETLPEYNLIGGLVAFDGDGKRSPIATPYNVPPHISDYVRFADSYSEYSPSLKGLRALVFGTIPTPKQNITRHFGDGTELSLYRGGWVTLSGLPFGDSSPTIEHRQRAIDRLIAELWPELNGDTGLPKDSLSAARLSIYQGETFILDWNRQITEDRVRQFIQGWNRTPKQLADITATWDLSRGWIHGSSPDSSMYTKRMVEEALWLQHRFGWTLQDVVDIVITFCKKHQLQWTLGRAKKQISDGQRYISRHRLRREDDSLAICALSINQQTHLTLTCNGSQISGEQNRLPEPILTSPVVNHLDDDVRPKSPDSLQDSNLPEGRPKLSGPFSHKSAPRNAVIEAISKHPGWVKLKTVAMETGIGAEAVRKQLQRLSVAGFVDRDGNGRYRRHWERKVRKLKPCCLKPIPLCQGKSEARKLLSRTELAKRGWPKGLIANVFPQAGKDYVEKDVVVDEITGRVVKARFFWVSRIKEIECQLWFEVERAKMLRPSRSRSQV